MAGGAPRASRRSACRRCASAACMVNASSHLRRCCACVSSRPVLRPVDRPDGQLPRPEVVLLAHLARASGPRPRRVSRASCRSPWRSSTSSAWRWPGRPRSARWRTRRRAPSSSRRRRLETGSISYSGCTSWRRPRKLDTVPGEQADRALLELLGVKARRWRRRRAAACPVPSVTMTSRRCFGAPFPGLGASYAGRAGVPIRLTMSTIASTVTWSPSCSESSGVSSPLV